MVEEHPNVEVMKRFNPADPAGAKDLFADGGDWQYFNPDLPDLQGDYIGVEGIRTFFHSVGKILRGTFNIEPIFITPVGDELVVVQVRDTLTFDGKFQALDVVVVWRIVDGRIVEVWDIVPGQPAEDHNARH